MSTPKNNEDKRIIYDDLNKIRIEQLHRATLNFSDNSLETKKLCVAVLSGVFTIIAGINRERPIGEWLHVLAIFGILIPLLFYIVDAVFWFYQRKLREEMVKEENKIRRRHGIEDREYEKMGNWCRAIKALFNSSQLMYYGLILISILIFWRSKS